MAQLHIKGRLLQLLAERGPQWDYELADRIAAEYAEVKGEYWHDTVRLTLADLYSSGLITSTEETLDPEKTCGREKLLFRFAVTEFGRERMQQTGLLATSGRAGEAATVGVA
jgi:hypothetical protein